VYVSVCLSVHTITYIFFLLGSYVDWRKISESSNVKITGQRHFAEGSRSFSKVKSYFCEIPYQMASFSGFSKRP